MAVGAGAEDRRGRDAFIQLRRRDEMDGPIIAPDDQRAVVALDHVPDALPEWETLCHDDAPFANAKPPKFLVPQ